MARTRRLPSERILVAGTVDDLADIQAVLDALPDNAYGQVYVEATMPDEVRSLRAPGRVTVTWLLRASRPSELRPLVFADRGESLAHAIVGWAGEWMSDDPADGPTLLWIGCDANPWVEQVRNLVVPAAVRTAVR
jgi:NADPH-dependent ferric siderophore reductase